MCFCPAASQMKSGRYSQNISIEAAQWMGRGRRVFYNIDKDMIFLKGTPTESNFVGFFFFLQAFVCWLPLQTEELYVKKNCKKITVFYLKMIMLPAKWKYGLLK